MSKTLVPSSADDLGDADGAHTTVDALVAAVDLAAAGDGWPVAVLNPEAGNHDITLDPLELAAALRAGERTWRNYPYYELRYAERGRRFTRSDSAWIVTAAKEPLSGAKRQLRWLAAVLASRGMPRWLLEMHLGELHAGLVTAVPENRAAYDHLLEVAAMFRRERSRHLEEAVTAELAAAFDQRVGPDPTPRIPEAGMLLVAAVADERAGLAGGVDSLLEWLADPARFSADWVSATTEIIAAARTRAL
jgi:hypothetical protein